MSLDGGRKCEYTGRTSQLHTERPGLELNLLNDGYRLRVMRQQDMLLFKSVTAVWRMPSCGAPSATVLNGLVQVPTISCKGWELWSTIWCRPRDSPGPNSTSKTLKSVLFTQQLLETLTFLLQLICVCCRFQLVADVNTQVFGLSHAFYVQTLDVDKCSLWQLTTEVNPILFVLLPLLDRKLYSCQ